MRLTEELIELYSGVNDSEFGRQRFGIQNATENLQFLLSNKRIKNNIKEELYNQLSTLLQRISNLSQTLPSVSFKDYSKIIAEIKKRFDIDIYFVYRIIYPSEQYNLTGRQLFEIFYSDLKTYQTNYGVDMK